MNHHTQAAKDVEALLRGVEEMISPQDLEKKISSFYREGKPLVVKEGFDPSAPDIHLGHTVTLRKLRQFQDLGHEVVFLIGDFTGRIGDPTGKKESRRQLSEEEVLCNARTYAEQVNRILDPEKTRVEFNSSWLKDITLADLVVMMSHFTVARMIEREDFGERIKTGKPVGLHEFLYPVMQAYDSVSLRADVELGGTDQRFNLLMGRDMQRDFGQEPQVVILMPLLEGTDGVEKMSKSLGNYIGVNEPPFEVFHKTMTVPDFLIEKYFLLLTDVPENEIYKMKNETEKGILHPREWKKRLAYTIVKMFYGEDKARQADRDFEKAFVQSETPDGAREVVINMNQLEDGKIWIVKLLKMTGIPSSNSEARRLVQQGGVTLCNQRISDPELEVEIQNGDSLKVGKRGFYRLLLVE